MKKILKSTVVILMCIVMLFLKLDNFTYASEVTATESGAEIETTTEAAEEEEPVSDFQMIMTICVGMVAMAAIVVIFAAVGYKKNNLSEKGRNRDVF